MPEQLFEQILSKENFGEKETRDIVVPLFDALIYCHDMGIVHRDIKPENLLFSSKDLSTAQIKISDFGLARFLQEDNLATTTCGTPGYVAPEVLEEKPYNGKCDYWSVGIVMFILLSGEPPFFHEDNFELFELIKKCEYKMDKPCWQYVSAEAKDLLKRLLVADPSKRINGKEIQAHPWFTSALTNNNSEKLAAMRGMETQRMLQALKGPKQQ